MSFTELTPLFNRINVIVSSTFDFACHIFEKKKKTKKLSVVRFITMVDQFCQAEPVDSLKTENGTNIRLAAP